MRACLLVRVCLLLAAATPLAALAAQPASGPPSAAAGQSRAPLMGDVIDPIGRPLAGVEVAISGTPLVTRTDARGFWIFPDPPAGPFVLSARSLGYVAVVRPVNIVAGVPDTIPLVMRRVPRTLSTVEIRAHYDGALTEANVIAERLSQMRVSTGRLYGRADLLRLQPQNIVDLLIGIPGVKAARLEQGIRVTTSRAGVGALAIAGEGCPLQFYLNRMPVDVNEVAVMSPLQFKSVEVYPITTMLTGLPFMKGTCGAVVISTMP